MLIVFTLSLLFSSLNDKSGIFTEYLVAMLLFFLADLLSIVNILYINSKLHSVNKKEYK